MEPRQARLAFWVAWICAALSLIANLAAPVVGFLEALVFAAIAWGIRRRQPWAAVTGVCLALFPALRAISDPQLLEKDQVVGLVICAPILLALAWFMLSGARSLWRPLRLWDAPWIAAAAALLCWPFCIRAYVMPTASMQETALLGDHIFVETVGVPLGRLPQRGELVVFRFPVDPKQTYLKRVVGVPGDRLSIRDKQLYRNGAPVQEKYVQYLTTFIDPYRDNFPAAPSAQIYPRALEMLEKNVSGGELHVPQGRYFVMGDNRDLSLDSRYWGFITREDMIGRPLLIYASYSSSTKSIANTRWERLLQLVR